LSRFGRFRLACNLLAALLLLIALRQLVEPAVTAIDPVAGSFELSCSPCRVEQDPVRLLDPQLRRRGWQTQGVAERIVARVQEPRVHRLLIASSLASALPLFLLFLGLSVAVRRFAQRGLDSNVIVGLRISGWSALAWGLMGPMSRSLQGLALDAVVLGSDRIRFPIDIFHVAKGVVIAGVVLAVIWAMEEALENKRDLAGYV
jgi:hypothetical protein